MSVAPNIDRVTKILFRKSVLHTFSEMFAHVGLFMKGKNADPRNIPQKINLLDIDYKMHVHTLQFDIKENNFDPETIDHPLVKLLRLPYKRKGLLTDTDQPDTQNTDTQNNTPDFDVSFLNEDHKQDGIHFVFIKLHDYSVRYCYFMKDNKIHSDVTYGFFTTDKKIGPMFVFEGKIHGCVDYILDKEIKKVHNIICENGTDGSVMSCHLKLYSDYWNEHIVFLFIQTV